MKKYMISLAVSSLLVIALTVAIIFPFVFARENTEETLPPGDATLPETENEGKDFSFETVTTTWGTFQAITTSEDGYYELYSNPDPMVGSELRYYGFESMKREPMAEAKISDIMGGAVPLVAGDKLYIFKTGDTPIPAANFEGLVSYIMQMDFDGSNRKMIELERNQTFTLGGMIAYDGSRLYFIRNEWSAENYLEESVLCSVDFEDGFVTSHAVLSHKATPSIIGVFPDGVVMQTTTFRLAGENAPDGEEYIPVNTLSAYSLREQKLIDIPLQWENGMSSYVVDEKGLIYYNIPGEDTLHSYNILTGKTTNYEMDLSMGSGGTILLTDEIRDGHYLCYRLEDYENMGATKYCAYNLETGECIEISLFFINPGTEFIGRHVVIEGETETHFVVMCGMSYVPRTFTNPDGVEITFDEGIVDYALIAKEDYWNSNPVYQVFEK